MNDIQGMLNAMGEMGRITRGQYQLTIGDAIEKLEDARQDDIISFDTGGGPYDPDSYRGYYSDLAFTKSDKDITVGDFLKALKDALGETFTGYKGGDFVMEESTPLWCASYGSCGPAMMDIISNDEATIITTKEVD